MTDNPLRAALESELAMLPADEAELSDFDKGAASAYHFALSFLAASATDEGPDDERTPMFAHEVVESARPAAPVAWTTTRELRIEGGPVVVSQTKEDPGDMGEPRVLESEGVTYVAVPDFDVWGRPAVPVALDVERLRRALYVGLPMRTDPAIVADIVDAYERDDRTTEYATLSESSDE